MGMLKLEKLIKQLAKKCFQFEKHTESLFAIQAKLREIEGLKREIDTLNDKIDYFMPDKELLRARDSLQKRLNGLLKIFEEAVMQQRLDRSNL